MTQADTPLAPRTAGNENTGLIKIIAILFMLIDHVGVVFFNPTNGLLVNSAIYSLNLYNSLRVLGRFGFPLFCWGIVVGTEYTRNIWKYMLRIFVVGAIAQPCFMLGLAHKWYELNVFPTLGLGVFAIAGIKWRRYGSHIWMPFLALLIPMLVQMDYGWVGVGLILVMYACRKSKGALAAGYVACCLFMGVYWGSFNIIFGVTPSMLQKYVSWYDSSTRVLLFRDLVRLYFQLEFWAVLALPLIVIPMKGSLRVPKWIGYSAYPFHLLVLGVIRHWDEIVAFFTPKG